MPIIAARRYIAGKPGEHSLKIGDGPRDDLPPRAFDWIGLAEPTPDEMDTVRQHFGLHPLSVEDALNPNQLP
jgi:magnesium transporter